VETKTKFNQLRVDRMIQKLERQLDRDENPNMKDNAFDENNPSTNTDDVFVHKNPRNKEKLSDETQSDFVDVDADQNAWLNDDEGDVSWKNVILIGICLVITMLFMGYALSLMSDDVKPQKNLDKQKTDNIVGSNSNTEVVHVDKPTVNEKLRSSEYIDEKESSIFDTPKVEAPDALALVALPPDALSMKEMDCETVIYIIWENIENKEADNILQTLKNTNPAACTEKAAKKYIFQKKCETGIDIFWNGSSKSVNKSEAIKRSEDNIWQVFDKNHPELSAACEEDTAKNYIAEKKCQSAIDIFWEKPNNKEAIKLNEESIWENIQNTDEISSACMHKEDDAKKYIFQKKCEVAIDDFWKNSINKAVINSNQDVGSIWDAFKTINPTCTCTEVTSRRYIFQKKAKNEADNINDMITDIWLKKYSRPDYKKKFQTVQENIKTFANSKYKDAANFGELKSTMKMWYDTLRKSKVDICSIVIHVCALVFICIEIWPCAFHCPVSSFEVFSTVTHVIIAAFVVANEKYSEKTNEILNFLLKYNPEVDWQLYKICSILHGCIIILCIIIYAEWCFSHITNDSLYYKIYLGFIFFVDGTTIIVLGGVIFFQIFDAKTFPEFDTLIQRKN